MILSHVLVKLRVNSDLHIGLATRDNSLLAVTADCRIIGLTSRYQSTLFFTRLAAYRRLDSRGDRLQVGGPIERERNKDLSYFHKETVVH
ncbi:MAG: hypothetical protein IIA89_12970, partial [Chloroflexi bacterium]|nr:hypothetical protein [Chloroflexota bacterium]